MGTGKLNWSEAMKNYRIENVTSGVIFGVYAAKDRRDALDHLAVDSGYDSWDDSVSRLMLTEQDIDEISIVETDEESSSDYYARMGAGVKQ